MANRQISGRFRPGEASEAFALQQAADGTLSLQNHMTVPELLKLLGETRRGGE